MSGTHDHHGTVSMTEAPVSMLVPLGVVSTAIVAAGVFAGTIVNTLILPFLH